jgi:hypothetical protein
VSFDAIGYRRAVSKIAVQILKRMVIPVALLLTLMIVLGLLVTRVLDDVWPFTAEDAVNRGLESARTGPLNAVSLVFSTLASTQAVIAVTAVTAVGLRLVLHRWREPLFLICAVTAQALVFFLTTLVIDRQRPAGGAHGRVAADVQLPVRPHVGVGGALPRDSPSTGTARPRRPDEGDLVDAARPGAGRRGDDPHVPGHAPPQRRGGVLPERRRLCADHGARGAGPRGPLGS